ARHQIQRFPATQIDSTLTVYVVFSGRSNFIEAAIEAYVDKCNDLNAGWNFWKPHYAVHSKNNENDIHENDTDAGSGSGTIQRGLARTYAQQKAPAPLITYFSHDSVDASFAQALASTASRDLYSRKDRQGKTWAIHSNSRGKSDEGVLHTHEDWTGVVVIMSGSA